jgi:hypothetical protein
MTAAPRDHPPGLQTYLYLQILYIDDEQVSINIDNYLYHTGNYFKWAKNCDVDGCDHSGIYCISQICSLYRGSHTALSAKVDAATPRTASSVFEEADPGSYGMTECEYKYDTEIIKYMAGIFKYI